ncbi:hypothetical protein [Methanoculleus sp.]|uniref:hypothetical protein n=1 Tax=Methanoculleus sp. TaxID=90427 RepID=UPI0025EEF97C|nr:hypothetical protein [Methanoculleus sp.]
MTEYEAAPNPTLSFSHMDKEAGFLVFLEYSGLAASQVYTDTSTREIDPSAMVMCGPVLSGDEGDPVFWPSVADTVLPDIIGAYAAEKLPIRHMGRTNYKGKTYLIDGMFNSRDKLARIGVVCTVTGVPLGNTDVILNGINHREIVRTDHRGVWWKYLEIDEYPDALFISPNGIVYALLEQVERLPDNEGIFDQVVRRRTLANATSRQFHRKFV